MLEEIKKSYIKAASIIKDWQTISVNTLANNYIDNESDEDLKAGYFSAILLRKWAYIGKHYATSKASGFTIEDCYDMVIHGIQYALQNRKWRDPKNKLYTDKCGPDKVLNRCIASARDIQYYNANTHKRKANFGKTSLDMIEENVKDCNEVILDESADLDEYSDYISIDLLIDKLIDNNKILEAIIVKNIVAGDCFVSKVTTTTKISDDNEYTTKSYTQNFKLAKLINNLYSYSEDDLRDICSFYCISKEKEESLINLFKNTKKTKFDKVIKSTLASMSEDNVIRDYLCY